MPNKKYIEFVFASFLSNAPKHASVFFIFFLVVFLLGSVMFVSTSIQKDIFDTLDAQADFTIQRYKAGKALDTPASWIDEFLQLDGVSEVEGRVYGRHFYEPNEIYFMIVGVDFFDDEISKDIKSLIKDVDIEKFLSRDNMIIGDGVKRLLEKYKYNGYYNFRPPDRSIKKVYIYATLPKKTNIVSSDMVIVDMQLAKEILGVEDGYVTDIVLNIANKSEKNTILNKLIMSHFDMRIIQKDDIEKYYKNLFNYKGGFFMVLYLVVLVSFLILLYQRYSSITHDDAKEIAVLRSLGWRIQSIIYLKMIHSFIISFSAYMLGVVVAYIYVFVFNAPLLKNIFLLSSNLYEDVVFTPDIGFGDLVLLFLFCVVPFVMVVILPSYKKAIIEPSEITR